MHELTFYGHSCCEIETNEGKVIIDPWLSGNPLTNKKWQDIKVDYILLTHGHFDHFGDALDISEKCAAPIICVSELATYCERKNARIVRMNIGGKKRFPFGTVKFTPALHTTSILDGETIICAGAPIGIVLSMQGKTIYHAGDTGIFADMKLIGDTNEIELALLPIGDTVVMGIDDAIRCLKWVKPRKVVPIHYNTFPAIMQNPEEFKEKVHKETASECIILNPGEKLRF